MAVGGRKWKILENAVGVEELLGLRRRHTRWREGEDGVEEFFNFLEGYFVEDGLGVLGKYDWGKG